MQRSRQATVRSSPTSRSGAKRPSPEVACATHHEWSDDRLLERHLRMQQHAAWQIAVAIGAGMVGAGDETDLGHLDLGWLRHERVGERTSYSHFHVIWSSRP